MDEEETEVTDTSSITRTSELTDSASVTNDSEVIGKGKPGKSPKKEGHDKPRLKVDTLYITTTVDRALGQEYAASIYGLPSSTVKAVSTRMEFVRLLNNYSTIGRLILDFHGSPGELQIGNTIVGLGDDAESYFKDYAPVVTGPVILEACETARGAQEVIRFGKIFKARRIEGWAMFHGFRLLSINVGANNTEADILAKMRPWLDYALPGSPTPADLVGQEGDQPFIVEWFQENFYTAPMPEPPLPGAQGYDAHRSRYKQRKDRKNVVVNNKDMLAERLLTTPKHGLVEYIVYDLTQF